MKLTKRLPVVLVLVAAAFIGLSAAAQEQTDGLALLKKVQDTYSSMKTFRAEGRLASTVSSPPVLVGGGHMIPRSSETAFAIAMSQPDKLRVENKDPGEGSLKVLSGKTIWTYTTKINKYSTADVSTPAGAKAKADALDDYESFRGSYKKLLDGVKSATVVREESLQVDGQEVKCDVLRIERKRTPKLTKSQVTFEVDPFETVWVDKTRFLVLKKTSMSKSTMSGPLGMEFDFEITTYLDKVAVNEPIPDELFTFVPPPGATKTMRGRTPTKPQPTRPH